MFLCRRFGQFSTVNHLKHLQRAALNSTELVRPFHVTFCGRNQEETGLELNPYYERYEDKIKKAKEQGIYVPVKEDKRLKEETSQWKRNIAMAEGKLDGKEPNEEDIRGSKLPKTLNEIINVDMLQDKNSEEITYIWTEFYKKKNCISSVIPKDIFNRIISRATNCPLFLYPLPKDNGYEFILSQFVNNRCFFTSLINYQVHGENAPWQLCMTYYTELKETKGIVLMTSELDNNTMNILEAQCLAQLQQLFYASSDEKYFDLVKTFNHNPEGFKHMDLVGIVEGSNIIVKPLNAK